MRRFRLSDLKICSSDKYEWIGPGKGSRKKIFWKEAEVQFYYIGESILNSSELQVISRLSKGHKGI